MSCSMLLQNGYLPLRFLFQNPPNHSTHKCKIKIDFYDFRKMNPKNWPFYHLLCKFYRVIDLLYFNAPCYSLFLYFKFPLFA